MVVTEKLSNGTAELIGREDLQAILRKKLGKGLVVVDATTSSFLPPGENFACAIYAIQAIVKRDDTEPEERLELIGKVFPLAQNVREMFDFSACFRKEIFFYDRLMPAYRQLQVDFDIDEDDIFEVGPKFFGTRFSRITDSKDIDDGVLILMENLKKNGYYTLNKMEGLDLTHARFTIKGLARFHALGIACKRHRPDFFRDEVLDYASTTLPSKPDELNGMMEFMNAMMRKDPRIAPYGQMIDDKLMAKSHSLYGGERGAREPWLSIVHFDFWTNNVLYRRADEGAEPDSMRIIDFQNYSYGSPLRDLIYFACTSISHKVTGPHLDELLDLYYESFVDCLGALGCDAGPFSRASFDAQLKLDSVVEFFHSILAIKFFCAEIDKKTYDQSQLEEVVIYSDINQLGYDRWHNVVQIYEKQGWL